MCIIVVYGCCLTSGEISNMDEWKRFLLRCFEVLGEKMCNVCFFSEASLPGQQVVRFSTMKKHVLAPHPMIMYTLCQKLRWICRQFFACWLFVKIYWWQILILYAFRNICLCLMFNLFHCIMQVLLSYFDGKNYIILPRNIIHMSWEITTPKPPHIYL